MPNFEFDLEKLNKTLEGLPDFLDKQFEESQEKVDKSYEEKLALFDQLDNLRDNNPTEYQSSFDSLNAENKKHYLWHLQSEGELNKEEYKDQVHDAYREEFQKNAKKGIYTGYVPYEVDGKTLFVKARHFDPSVNETFRGEDDFVRNSVLPHDTFYFPEKHQKQPDLTEKDWLVGMADPSGNIQYVSGITYNPNTQGGYKTTVEGRAKEILEPDTGFMGTLAPIISLAGTITGNPLLSAAGTAAVGGDFEDIAKSVVVGQVAPDILENTLASVNITNDTINDLFGTDIGSTAWSEGLTEIQPTVVEGGSIKNAVGKVFGGELLEPVGEVLEDIVPVIDVPEIVEDLGNAVVAVAEPVLNTIEEISEPVVQATQAVIEPIITPIVETVEEITPEIQETFEQLVEEVAPIVEKVIVEPVEQVAPIAEELAKVITPIVENVAVEPVEKIVETITPIVEEVVIEPIETITPIVEEVVIEPVTSVVENVADNLGIDNELVGVTEERFSEVMSEAEEAMLAGESGKDVIIKELGGDIIGELGEGAENLLGNIIDVAETVLSPVEPLVEPFADLAGAVLSPAGDLIESGIGAISDVTSEFEDVVRETGSAIDDTLIQPALGAVAPVVELIEAGGRAIDKNITQPTLTAIGEGVDVISDVTSEVEDFVRVGGRAIDKNITQPTIETIDEIVRKIPNPPKIKLPDLEPPKIDIDLPEFTGLDVELPEFTAPDIDLDIDIDMPKVDLPSFNPNLLAGLMPTPQQPTQVEGLFDKELFKFDTEIKSTQEMLSPFMNLRRYG